jgi:hypothetical protein
MRFKIYEGPFFLLNANARTTNPFVLAAAEFSFSLPLYEARSILLNIGISQQNMWLFMALTAAID